MRHAGAALLTGATGFIGQHVATHLQSHGWRVIGAGSGCDIEVIRADALAAVVPDIDVIIHCAGGASVAQSIADPAGEFYRTVPPVIELLELLRRHRPTAKLVIVSSAAVYGAVNRLPIAESSELRPVSPYGMHKRIVEDAASYYAGSYGIPVAIVRLFSVYGAGLKKQLLWDASCKALKGDFVFGGTGREIRDWLHVSDAASLLVAAAGMASPDAPVFNGGTAAGSTVSRVLELLFQGLGVDASPEFSGAERPGDPAGYVADITRAVKLGWSPRVALDEGVASYARWFRERS